MKNYQLHMKETVIISALVFTLIAGNALAVFLEPTVPAPGNNVLAPLHTGSLGQIKEGGFGANQIATASRLCFGPFSCIDKWWDTAPNTCRLEVKKVNSNSVGMGGGTSAGVADNTCNFYLTASSKAAGWAAVGSDLCGTMWDRDCQRPSTCIYMRMKCGGSVITELPTKSPTPGIENHPVPGFTQ
jgi:hypothetical protein